MEHVGVLARRVRFHDVGGVKIRTTALETSQLVAHRVRVGRPLRRETVLRRHLLGDRPQGVLGELRVLRVFRSVGRNRSNDFIHNCACFKLITHIFLSQNSRFLLDVVETSSRPRDLFSTPSRRFRGFAIPSRARRVVFAASRSLLEPVETFSRLRDPFSTPSRSFRGSATSSRARREEIADFDAYQFATLKLSPSTQTT